jgi:2,4-dienoyl-CoA reductase-like NADH-dependent reductase (Old Yellow Enzyme family)
MRTHEGNRATVNSFNSPWQIGSVRIKNRLVRSATNLRIAGPRGEVTDELIAAHERLAAGGIGLVVTGHAFVTLDGRAGQGQIGAYDDMLRQGLEKLAGAAHAQDVKVFLQISHGGTRSLPLRGERIGPSEEDGALEMTRDDIERVMAGFVSAAALAEKAGFDGVQIHAAHRYLLSQFLSPLANRRRDEYGGKEGGARFIKRIITGIKGVVNKGFIVAIKMGADTQPNGNGKEDVLWIVKELIPAGLDWVEISRGYAQLDETVAPKIKPHVDEAYNLDVAAYIKSRLPDLPMTVVGGFRSIEAVEAALSQNIDAVALSRPLIREPGLPLRWMLENKSPSYCVSCMQCIKGKGPVTCAMLESDKRTIPTKLPSTESDR